MASSLLFYQPSPTYSVLISTLHQLAESVYYSNSILRHWQKSPKPGFSPPGRDTSSSSAKDDSSPCHSCYVAIQCQMCNLRGLCILMGGYTLFRTGIFPKPRNPVSRINSNTILFAFRFSLFCHTECFTT